MSTSAKNNLANELIEWLRSYCKTKINFLFIDERRCISPNIVIDFGNKGLLGLQIPKKYGGLALSYTDTNKIMQQLGAIDLTLALFIGINNTIGTTPILGHASKNIKDKLLPQIAQGRLLAAFALTEYSAGSNPAAMETTAKNKNDGGWIINGEKTWIGQAAYAGVINVFAKQLDNNGDFVGFSGFIIEENSKGLSIGEEALTMGLRGSIQSNVILNDVFVPKNHLLGQPGEGVMIAQQSMSYARLMIGAVCLGAMKRCTQLAANYASNRFISTGKLLNNPSAAIKLIDMTNSITCLETLLFKMTATLDQKIIIPEPILACCKVIGSEHLWTTVDNAIQLLGGRGYLENNILPRFMRDARVFRIFEGPTETLLHFIGVSLITNPEATINFLKKYLHAEQMSKQLCESLKNIKETHIKNKVPYNLRTLLVGDLFCYALLLSTLEQNKETKHFKYAHAWARNHFNRCLERANNPDISNLTTTAAEALAYPIKHVYESIGDLESNAANINYVLDPLLKSPGV